eukprot:5090431-Prymnesium_polylepis.3
MSPVALRSSPCPFGTPSTHNPTRVEPSAYAIAPCLQQQGARRRGQTQFLCRQICGMLLQKPGRGPFLELCISQFDDVAARTRVALSWPSRPGTHHRSAMCASPRRADGSRGSCAPRPRCRPLAAATPSRAAGRARRHLRTSSRCSG